MKFQDVFKNSKPIMGMLHLKGDSHDDILKRAMAEADMMASCGVDAFIVEDYFGDEVDVINVLSWLSSERPHYCYGVNILQQFEKTYDTGVKYKASFMQVDSICGHLTPEEDAEYEKITKAYHDRNELLVLGGVRFKYKKVLSGRTLEEDLKLGMERCDAIVVTGDATGVSTDFEKIKQFRQIMGSFPLIVGAGLTKETVPAQLSVGDGGIVGSTFKYKGDAHNDVCRENVAAFMDEVRKLR